MNVQNSSTGRTLRQKASSLFFQLGHSPPLVSTYISRHWCWSHDECYQTIPPLFLHTVNGQKLDNGETWNEAYVCFKVMHLFPPSASDQYVVRLYVKMAYIYVLYTHSEFVWSWSHIQTTSAQIAFSITHVPKLVSSPELTQCVYHFQYKILKAIHSGVG